MDSNNTTITTAGGYTVELRPFITGRQKRFIEAAFTEDVELKNEAGATSFSMQASKASVAQDRAIEAVVVSVTGTGVDATKKTLDQVLDLPAEDFDEVFKKVDEITGGAKKDESTPKT